MRDRRIEKGGLTTMEIRKILFPHDLSENASKIIPFVLSVAEAYNSDIYLLHVVHDLQKWGKVYIPHGSMDVLQKEALEEAGKQIDRVRTDQFRGYSNMQTKVVSGDPAGEILNTIVSESIDLVIIGTHGRKGLEHVLFGSVAETVVKKSSVPVMTINPYKIK
jgi:nucleotide-binding universal stress UspA family protein